MMAANTTKVKTSILNKIVGFLHLLCFFLVLFTILIILVVIVFIFLAVLLFVLGLLCIILLLFLGRLNFAKCFPFGRKTVSLSFVISDDDVIKDGATFNLPQIEAYETEIFVFVNIIIIFIFRICNLLGLPKPFVCWVRNPLARPVTLAH